MGSGILFCLSQPEALRAEAKLLHRVAEYIDPSAQEGHYRMLRDEGDHDPPCPRVPRQQRQDPPPEGHRRRFCHEDDPDADADALCQREERLDPSAERLCRFCEADDHEALRPGGPRQGRLDTHPSPHYARPRHTQHHGHPCTLRNGSYSAAPAIAQPQLARTRHVYYASS